MDQREELAALRRMAELEERAKATPAPKAPTQKELPSLFSDPSEQFTPEATQAQAAGGIGVARGIGDVGNTLINATVGGVGKLFPSDGRNKRSGFVGELVDSLEQWNAGRKSSLNALDQSMAQDPALGAAYGAGRTTGNMVATAPVGGALGQIATKFGATPAVSSALASSGFTTGAPVAPGMVNALKDVGLRSIAGAAVGGASAGLVDPSNAGMGAAVGGGLPIATKTARVLGSAVGSAASKMIPKASPEVAQLADRAKELGIDLPADRLIDSRPVNALASSLNYVPMSGRASVEDKMYSQFNRAVSKTIGQDSDNMAQALRSASKDLGQKFENVLKNNKVRVDEQFLNELADSANKATRELEAGQAGVIGRQVDEIIAKAGNGEIDGQAAYNIKKTLDRIGNRNTPEAYYARDLKKALMGALDRSLGPEEAKAFSNVRQQYGNMLDLEGLVPNGAEGGLSVGRFANMKGIGNPQLQELADIAGQFLKTREAPHGAAQRVVLGGLGATAAGFGAAPYVGATMATGRGANAMLNSDWMRNAALGRNAPANALALPGTDLGFQMAPVFIATNPR